MTEGHGTGVEPEDGMMVPFFREKKNRTLSLLAIGQTSLQ